MTRAHRLVLAAAVALGAGSTAAPRAAAAACDGRNLVAGRAPVFWRAVYRPERITDGIVAEEGDPGDGTAAAVLGPGGTLTFDLGEPSPVGAVFLQAETGDGYRLEVSSDGQTWSPQVALPAPGAAGGGLRTRVQAGIAGAPIRLLRIARTGTSNLHALAELAVFCRAPTVLPLFVEHTEPPPSPAALARFQAVRKLAVGGLATLALVFLLAALPAAGRRRRAAGPSSRAALASAGAALAPVGAAPGADGDPDAGRAWSPAPGAGGATSIGLVLASAACAVALGATFGPMLVAAPVLVVVGLLLLPRSRWGAALGRHARLPARVAAGLLAIAATCAFTNFGHFQGAYSVHYHDAAHYFLGARYAEGLHYDRLYDCLGALEIAEARWPADPARPVRDLRSNELVTLGQAAKRGAACPTWLGPEDWAAFRRDALVFQSELHPGAWAGLLTDHGYNATPAWTFLLRGAVLGRAPASAHHLEHLAHLDEVLLVLLVPLLLWGLGAEPGALAVLLLGLGFPWVYMWTGGSIGRSVWLVALLGGVALLRRQRPAAGGILLGLAAALQIFPVLVLLGPLLTLLGEARRRRGLRKDGVWFLAGVALGAGVPVVGSLLTLPPELWLEFLGNSSKHLASVSANRIGLAPLAASLGISPRLGAAAGGLFSMLVLTLAWRRRRLAEAAALAVLLPPALLPLSSYYLASWAALGPVLAGPWRAACALGFLVLLPQAGALLYHGDPGPAYYAITSAVFFAFATGLLVALWRQPVTFSASATPADTT